MSKKLSPIEQKSSKTVLDELRKHTQGMLKGKMDGLKKVTVASDSKEGLAKGLDLAKKIAGKSPEEASHAEDLKQLMGDSAEEEVEESPEEEASESPEEEQSEQADGSEVSPEEEEMTADQLQKRIEVLMALKSKKQ